MLGGFAGTPKGLDLDAPDYASGGLLIALGSNILIWLLIGATVVWVLE